VAAACGLKVAKHGNRAMSSQCGSADVLEALGIKIDLSPEQVQKCLEKVGMGFMLATVFHPAMKFAAVPRKEVGIRTVFNILGPLTNPASAGAQVLGVPKKNLTETMAMVLKILDCQHALVVHGEDGLDEITITGKTFVSELQNGTIKNYEITPEDVGLSRASPASLKGGTARENAELLRSILSGKKGAQRDIVLMNAAAALIAGSKAATFKGGIAEASAAIVTGKALQKLEDLVKFSQNPN
jgi:anthranilate phosphoribosyltransferase